MKKTGRPIVAGDKRSKLVAFYLTPDDASKLKNRAEKGGFKSMSSLVTALMEPIIQGGFSLRSGVSALSRVQKFMESNGDTMSLTMSGLKEELLALWQPPPPIVPEEYNISQLKQDLQELLIELEETQTLTMQS